MTSLQTKFNKKTIVIALVAIIGGYAIYHHYSNPAQAAAQGASQGAPVDVAEVVNQTITDWQTYSGRLEAVDRVEIRPLVSGTLTTVHFKDGALVKKGDVLFTIDPRPYEAEVARAQAQKTAADARSSYATAELARSQRLIDDNAIARRDFDEKQNDAREAAAKLLAANAALKSALLNLEYTQITAPVTGRVSRAEVTQGNIVSAGATSVPLTTLVSVSNIYASFDVDEQTYLKFVSHEHASNRAPIQVALGLANEDGYSRQGKISSVDNRLDTTSGTIRVRAVFENADGVLLPGLYARVRLGSGTPREALLIDEKAIGTDQDKRFVLVVDENSHANYREIHLGAIQNGLRVVESGLKAGERIVVNGLQRVRPGDPVSPQVVQMPGTEATSIPAASLEISKSKALTQKATKPVNAVTA
ncbi:efflux transporter periplasmic adaptor subunit [Methylovorus sp. MM2]|uniref:efflux RND transporter periplasmic adaptor subunit n=1 Tax=Methylovorus sp. MM2 TaxID=1848038 RepID=UPI0007DE8312|nr:efflux RND transporter periplasmic adaptor subunit [Methylovorus sp. MM2]OAM52534.1 efflux transporter periplasmic adaptor subunit [Methylovorus sp. MM2]